MVWTDNYPQKKILDPRGIVEINFLGFMKMVSCGMDGKRGGLFSISHRFVNGPLDTEKPSDREVIIAPSYPNHNLETLQS